MIKHDSKEIKQYKFVKGAGAIVRNNFSADPLEFLNQYGTFGKVINKAGNKLIEAPIHKVSFAITGLMYDNKKDPYTKGSLTYTGVNCTIKKILKTVFGFVFSIPVITSAMTVVFGDIEQKLGALFALLLFLGAIAGVWKIKSFFKKKFKIKGSKYATNER